MKYEGSCHCGNVRFAVVGELTAVVSCNCSICMRKGALLWAVPRSDLHLEPPVEELGTYTFNHHTFHHRFCPRCGIHPFSESRGEDGANAFINVRCLDVDLSGIPVIDYDGRAVQ